ncbi:flagellar basal body rod protein FlgB [Thiomicrospira microaerophila]|uniref:flagellar basal body rod protein FlgB n=1 Tax=Thiomicrospira microaerophila TaxID=406020 RepID=UPI0005CB3EE3|nr:flagellar basal body rod protein FlgB [Thiomicrospira microaerophila]
MSNSIFGIHESAMLVRRDRAEVLANNLANADTPNFKARDIDFRKAIHEVSLSADTRFKPDMQRTNARHLEGFAELSTRDYLKYRMPTQPSLDGNTVETHIEKAKFAENALHYQATLEFLDSRIKSISGALKGE